MSHTYSRTAGLFDGFCSAFGDADLLILHRIYGSAREAEASDNKGPGVTGQGLFKGIKAQRESSERGEETCYFHEIEDARDFLLETLKPGDLFLTMGAGNNWTLGRNLYNQFNDGEKQ